MWSHKLSLPLSLSCLYSAFSILEMIFFSWLSKRYFHFLRRERESDRDMKISLLWQLHWGGCTKSKYFPREIGKETQGTFHIPVCFRHRLKWGQKIWHVFTLVIKVKTIFDAKICCWHFFRKKSSQASLTVKNLCLRCKLEKRLRSV